MKKNHSKLNLNRGYTLFLAMVVAGTLLVITAGVATLAVRQASISSAGKDSQMAFYAADTGLECAFYWDIRNPSGISAFATSTTDTIECNRDGSNSGNQWIVGGSSQSTFTITFNPDPYCAVVVVDKFSDGSTRIESFGYNTCSSSSPRRVERAVRASY